MLQRMAAEVLLLALRRFIVVCVCVFLTAPSLILWQMVSLGIKGLFEMVKETWRSHPELCKKALQSFFEVLQGLDPETLEQEPEEVIGESALSVCVCACTCACMHARNKGNCDAAMQLQCPCLLFALRCPEPPPSGHGERTGHR